MRVCQASAWAEVATFLIKRKWPKAVAALGFHSSNTPVAPEVRASLSLPRESDKERPGSPPDPRAGRQPSSGGCKGRGPSAEGPPLRGRSALTGGPVPPCAPLPSGGNQFAKRSGANCEPAGATPPQPATGRGRFWADVSPLGRMQEISPPRGPKGSLEPAGWPPLARKSFQPSAFRILSPFSALVVYSESGAQPSAIQTLLSRTWQRAPASPGCRAPREA